MSIASVAEIYRAARAGGYAVGGFDAEHMDMVQAIVEAAEETRSPVIVFLWQEDLRASGPGYLEALVHHAAARARVPVAVMVDHATSVAFALRCLAHGHSGVMIDGTHQPYEENIALTRQVADLCHMAGVFVEGELGRVPRSFESDDPAMEVGTLTAAEQVADFVQRSGVDALAISIGNVSGLYENGAVLDVDLLKRIRRETDACLVLHGGSGLSAEQVRQVVAEGISGIRFATEMRLAYFDALEAARAALGRTNPDSRRILPPARAQAKALIVERMRQMGCAGRA